MHMYVYIHDIHIHMYTYMYILIHTDVYREYWCIYTYIPVRICVYKRKTFDCDSVLFVNSKETPLFEKR